MTRPARYVDKYPNRRNNTWDGVIVGLCAFIVVLAVSNLLRTGSVIA